MDSKEIRARNLELLASEHSGVSRLAAAVERPPQSISQMIHRHRPMGDKVAREIESHLGKPKGWLDLPQWLLPDQMADPLASALRQESQPPRLDPEILRSAHRLLREIYAEDEEGFKVYSIEDDPELFIVAYETLARLGNSAEPADFVALTWILYKQRAEKGRGKEGATERTSEPHKEAGKKRAAG